MTDESGIPPAWIPEIMDFSVWEFVVLAPAAFRGFLPSVITQVPAAVPVDPVLQTGIDTPDLGNPANLLENEIDNRRGQWPLAADGASRTCQPALQGHLVAVRQDGEPLCFYVVPGEDSPDIALYLECDRVHGSVDALNLSSQDAELLFDPFVSAVDMVDIADVTGAFRTKGCSEQGDAGPDVGTAQFKRVQFGGS